MSLTVIDSLVVLLELDSGDLEKKAPAASKALGDVEKSGLKTEQTVAKVGKTSKETAGSVSTLSKSLISLFAIIGGAAALKTFVTDMISGGAAVDRLSKNLELGAGTIVAWGNATEKFGGSAEALQNTLSMLNKEQTNLLIRGESSLIPFFSMMGIAMIDAAGKARPVTDELRDMAAWAQGKDRSTAHNIFAQMGIDEGTINLLLSGRKELELTLAAQKSYGDQLAKFAPTATRLQQGIVGIKQHFELLGLTLLQRAEPAIEKVLNIFSRFGDWLLQNSEFVGDFLKVMAVGLGAVALAAAPINLTVLAVVALGAAIAALWNDYQVWKRGGDSLYDWGKWKPGIDAAAEAFEHLGSAMRKAWEWYSKFHDSDVLSTIRQKIGAEKTDAQHMQDLKKAAGAPIPVDREKYLLNYFQSQGWTKAQAAGIVSNLKSESNFNTKAVGDSGSAYGIAQWHKDRQDAFKAWSGKDIRNSNLAEQAAFVQYELTQGSRKSAGDALRGATTAYTAGDIVSRRYESPRAADSEAATRGSYAQTLAGIPGASAVASSAPQGAGNGTSSYIHAPQLTISEMNVQTQATDAPGIAADIYHSFDYLLTGQANYGLVP